MGTATADRMIDTHVCLFGTSFRIVGDRDRRKVGWIELNDQKHSLLCSAVQSRACDDAAGVYACMLTVGIPSKRSSEHGREQRGVITNIHILHTALSSES